MSLGWYISMPPPVINHHSPHAENQIPWIGLSGAGLNAQSAMKTTPEILVIFKDPLLGPYLGITDHLSGKMLIDERTDGSTRTAVEAIHGGIHSEPLQFL
jgi:hypothetical protein